MIDLVERLELASERLLSVDPPAAAACTDAANRFRAQLQADAARRIGPRRKPTLIARLKRTQKYALELMARFGDPCPIVTDEPTSVVGEVPHIHFNTATSLRRRGLVRVNQRSMTCQLTAAGIEVAAYASGHSREREKLLGSSTT